MKNGFVKSSSGFFRLITSSMYFLVVIIIALAAFIPAPLQEQANPAHTPNPAKSAWFLLWIQEIVSWSRFMIYPVMFLVGLFVLLPWLPVSIRIHRAQWFPREQGTLNVIIIILVIAIVGLTIMALFFRGANWSLVF